MRFLWIFGAALIAAGAGVYFWHQRSAADFEVQTALAMQGDVRRVVSTTGTVVALVSVEIGSQLSGNISEINVDYSSKVKTGEVLARIEPATFEMKVKEERAGIAIARANVALQEAGVKKAQASLTKADLDLERARKLVDRGASSQASLDEAVANQAGAEADLAIAKANVANARATVEQKEASLENAEVDLSRTYIRSPIDGVVIERAVEVGQTVAASFSAPKLFTIAQDLSHVQIEAEVDEADIGEVTMDDPVSFTVDAHPDKSFEGKVQQIRLAPTDLENVVTYTVIIAADNPDGALLPGMTANVSIVTGEHDNVLVVPNQALRFEPRGEVLALVSKEMATGSTGADDDRAVLSILKDGLKLPDEEIARVEAALRAEFSRADKTDTDTSPFSRTNPEERNRLRRNNVLRGQLSPEDFRRYQAALQQRAARHGTVWTYQNGALTPHQVELGLADSTGTEIRSGLGEGAAVVVWVRARDE